jgi:hypothetical protein
MRWLRGIALLILVWSLLATAFLQYCQPGFPQSATLDEIHARKVESTQDFISTAQTVAILLFVLSLLIDLVKRMLTSKSMAPNSSATPPLAAGLPGPLLPPSEGLPHASGPSHQ